MSLSLKHKGIDAVLEPSERSLASLPYARTATLTERAYGHAGVLKEAILTTIDGERVPLKIAECKKIGEGTYGKVCVLEMYGRQYAVKETDIIKPTHLQEIINEMLIQIILYNTNPAYVPKLYYFALSRDKKKAYLITELLEGTIGKFIKDNIHTEDQAEAYLPIFLLRLAHMLEYYGRRLHFVHRDLHIKNILYKAGEGGRYELKLIDFGFSTLNWNGLVIDSKKGYFVPGYREGANITYAIKNILYYDDLRSKLSRAFIDYFQNYLLINSREGRRNLIAAHPHAVSDLLYKSHFLIPLSYKDFKNDIISFLHRALEQRRREGNRAAISLAKAALAAAESDHY
jgi:serine/threonine protein kinase